MEIITYEQGMTNNEEVATDFGLTAMTLNAFNDDYAIMLELMRGDKKVTSEGFERTPKLYGVHA